MKVHFSINWSKTILYNAGKRDLTINWINGEGIPREGEAINIPKFIEGSYESDETFMHKNEELNVFDWIENTTGWEVEMVKWDHHNGTNFLHIWVGDKGLII
ncbi:hypothetical protein [Aquimarina algiphila]|uniref:Uncharacterized protein n=1 Tax=Aquimarina algiphila TaxID=2047982 RepID=A0A554VJC5_9FLAO|nr:hypothetical protein [Aquimarina algiphila]TSE07946.1 hypothetical protein FOF46_14580 [Aquimarina algiphila]